jgi:hypothetical protein
MEFPILNKFEKEQKVIELHKQGKTLKEISKIVHMSFRDISKIIKAYERKKELQAKREESNQSSQNKQPSIRNQFFKSYLQGNKMINIAVELDISAPKAEKLYFEVLKLNRMDECYEFYEDHSSDIPTLLTIDHFMKHNNISSGPDIVNVLRKANKVINLKQTILNLKTEIEKLKQTKNNYLLNQNTNYQPLLPLGLPKYYYESLL